MIYGVCEFMGTTLFTVEEMLEVVSPRVLAGDLTALVRAPIKRLWTDSRTVRKGDCFVALQGERFDGHAFVPEVFRKGATVALVDETYRVPADLLRRGHARRPALIFGVRDTLAAFQHLATHHRQRFRIPIVAVTGSNGKTTTKEMTASIFATRWPTLKTEGNLNNRIGVPQMLLRLTGRHQAAVIEMGVDARGQTTKLCEMVKPTLGIITNIGADHLEFFGDLEGSAQAKAELLDMMPPDGVVVLNADDSYFDYLAARAHGRVLSFGLSPRADVRATDVDNRGKNGATFKLHIPGRLRPVSVSLRVYGVHNVINALAAAATGCAVGLSSAQVAKGLGEFRPALMRSQVAVVRGARVINDCYNANPSSMKAAIQLLAEMGQGGRTIAVLGDMLELGPRKEEFHRDIGAVVAQRGIGELIACGSLGQAIAQGARKAGMPAGRIREVPDAAAAGALLKPMLKSGDTLLVKASRGMKLERVLEILQGRVRMAAGA
ncbi:UDP-N-acetylmuramoyl-tripeptide--D-alanyl-D-alanine ligase [Nitrospira sp.]|nr:UDP-N-acetylmuramoyl-tripeptide--D-alanyl-D-alanine ligase [Nitrospira sp.]